MNKSNWKSILIEENTLIIDAINLLTNTGLPIVIVVDKNLKLLASVTDGDIRKGLARGLSIKDKLSLVMNKNPKFVSEPRDLIQIQTLLFEDKFKAIPIVDKNKRIIDCYFYDHFFKSDLNPPFLIMAGGFGKRLGKLTENNPKPMLKVHNMPILEHIIKKARAENFTEIFISTHYKSEIIENYFGDGHNFNVNITYIKEEKPLGTGGSFQFMEKFKGPVLVTNADIISKIGYRKLLDFHFLNNGIATMAVIKNKIQNPFGVVKYDGINLIDFEEKPVWINYINAGIYVVDSIVAKSIKENTKLSMPMILKKLIEKNKSVFIFHMHEDWVDIGTPEQLREMNNKLIKGLS